MEPPGSSGHAHETGMTSEEEPHFSGAFPSHLFETQSEILIEDKRWHRHVPRVTTLIQRAVAQCADTGHQPGSVVLSCDRVVKRLNGIHRGKHRPTNVLTFDPPPGFPGGDIILALETVVREAHRAKKPVGDHLAHLIIHGNLHLAGYDHHHPGEARTMEMRESLLLSRLGISNPWKPRS